MIEDILNILPQKLRKHDIWKKVRNKTDYENLQEIRLRINRPVIIKLGNVKSNIVVNNSIVNEVVLKDVVLSREDINQCMQFISSYSVYAYQEDIRKGFITVKGGHRVGITGKAVLENGVVKSQQYISFINIRVAHEVKGCADVIMPFLWEGKLSHTLIISPPGCGKTTLLRDVIRQISTQKNVSVIDERSEIGACYNGEPQNDLGLRTDVLDCCPKAEGMLMMVRSMNPQVIAVDEIGGKNDIDALIYIINCGCVVIGTMHAATLNEAMEKPFMKNLIGKNIFSKVIVLSSRKGTGTVELLKDFNSGYEYITDQNGE